MIGGLLLFLISWTYCNESWSLKKYFYKNYKKVQFHPEKFLDQLSSVFFRILQIQISVIYAYTGFEKLKGNSWWDGTALWTVFANPQFAAFDLTWLQHFPLFFALGTFTTVVFEVYFPAMMMFRRTRLPWLLLGVIFHGMIGFTLGLMPFSLIMISTYFLFLERFDLSRFKNWFVMRFMRSRFQHKV
jgi:Vitamin K-dependent gamma-carboxylase